MSRLIGKFQLKWSYAINQLHKFKKPDITKQKQLTEYSCLLLFFIFKILLYNEEIKEGQRLVNAQIVFPFEQKLLNNFGVSNIVGSKNLFYSYKTYNI